MPNPSTFEIVISLFCLTLISCSHYQTNSNEVDRYNSDLNNWKSYVEKVEKIGNQHTTNIQNINENSESATDNEELLVYYNLLLDEYESWYSELSDIDPPKIAVDAHTYLLEFLKLCKTRALNLIEFCESGSPTYDIEKDNELLYQAEKVHNKAVNEFEKNYNYFNEEAEKLRLKKPFKN